MFIDATTLLFRFVSLVLCPSLFPPLPPSVCVLLFCVSPLDDTDLLCDRALTSGLGNIDQLLRSMEYMDQQEAAAGEHKKTNRNRTNTTDAKQSGTKKAKGKTHARARA